MIAIENPPIFNQMVPLPRLYINKVIFPNEVIDEIVPKPEHRFFSCELDGFIYDLVPLFKSARIARI